ncbi:MAG: superoxide dismutase family protein, partial [Myxococcales bacterium]
SAAATGPAATAQIEPRSGSALNGTAKFVDVQNGVVGRAIVVHERADDLKTDPAGNSGARIGCGVILAPPTQPSL